MITNYLNAPWLQKAIPIIESLVVHYQILSQEQKIWLWIISTTALLLLIGVFFYLIYSSFRGLNNLLQSPDGWRPINVKSGMWIGSAIWLLLVAHKMHQDQNPGWSVAVVCGLLAILGFGWFMIQRLKWWRAIGAFIANSCVGIILAPIIIQSVFFVLILIVACLLLWIYALFGTRRVVYVEY